MFPGEKKSLALGVAASFWLDFITEFSAPDVRLDLEVHLGREANQ